MSLPQINSPTTVFSNFEDYFLPIPKGRLKICEATPLPTGGAKTTRLCLQALQDQKYYLSASRNSLLDCFPHYIPFSVAIENRTPEVVFVNVSSIQKRFGLSRKVIEGTSLEKLIVLAKDLEAFQKPTSEVAQGQCEKTKLLSSRVFRSLIPLEEIAQTAVRESRDIYLPKSVFETARGIIITRLGLVAINTGETLGRGSYAKVKKSRTPNGRFLAKRVIEHNTWTGAYTKHILRILERFKNTPGILPTLGSAFYENIHEDLKIATFHPVYEKNLGEVRNIQTMPLPKRLKMAKQLLIGLNEIAKIGLHNDLYLKNILIRNSDSDDVEVVICDLDLFSFHLRKEEFKIPEIDWHIRAPELRDKDYLRKATTLEKADVWSMGIILLYLFGGHPLLNRMKNHPPSEALSNFLTNTHFPEMLIPLLVGMFTIPTDKRWSAEQCLAYAEAHFDYTDRDSRSV